MTWLLEQMFLGQSFLRLPVKRETLAQREGGSNDALTIAFVGMP